MTTRELQEVMPWWGIKGYRLEIFETQPGGSAAIADVRIGVTYSWFLPRIGERIHLYGRGGPVAGTSYAVVQIGYQFVNALQVDGADDIRDPQHTDIIYTNHVIVQVAKYDRIADVAREIEMLRRRLEWLQVQEGQDNASIGSGPETV